MTGPTAVCVFAAWCAGCASMVAPSGGDAGPRVDASTVFDASSTSDGTAVSDANAMGDASDVFGMPTPVRCDPAAPDRVIAPAVLFSDQALGLTVDSHGSQGCGRNARLDPNANELSWMFSACGGCVDCDCVDSGYESSLEQPAPMVGDHVLRVNDQTRPLRVIAPDACVGGDQFPMRDVHVEVVGPDRSLRIAPSTPQLYWAHVTATENRCCGTPALAARVNAIRPVNADLAVVLYECTPDPCDCVGAPRVVEAWVDLGALSSGRHGVVVSGAAAVVTFDVP